MSIILRKKSSFCESFASKSEKKIKKFKFLKMKWRLIPGGVFLTQPHFHDPWWNFVILIKNMQITVGIINIFFEITLD